MAGKKQSWFARHCAPPPPLNNTSACPCSACYNGGSHSSVPVCPCATCYNGGSHSAHSRQPLAVSRPTVPRRMDSDNSSIDSAETLMTTTVHIEHSKK